MFVGKRMIPVLNQRAAITHPRIAMGCVVICSLSVERSGSRLIHARLIVSISLRQTLNFPFRTQCSFGWRWQSVSSPLTQFWRRSESNYASTGRRPGTLYQSVSWEYIMNQPDKQINYSLRNLSNARWRTTRMIWEFHWRNIKWTTLSVHRTAGLPTMSVNFTRPH